jgi:serine/threonine-protein kinase
MPELALESTFAGCRIDAVAARGGMGLVYRATQLPLGRPVALKVITPALAADPTFHERFVRESRIAASLDHPNVIPVYGAGEEDGCLYLAMRWVDGTDLQTLIDQSGGLEPGMAVAVVAQVGAALDAAHAAGLVHRDVKPANVLIAAGNGSGHAYLSDFGLTLEASASTRLTRTGEWIGTAGFMAPEQFEGDAIDARTDVYALGCVLYAALCGRPPFARETVVATMLAHLRDHPPRPSATPGVPPGLDAVVARALAKRPADRYGSAGELVEAALAAVGSAPGGSRPALTADAAPRNGGGGLAPGAATLILPDERPAPTAAPPNAENGATARLTRAGRRRRSRLAIGAGAGLTAAALAAAFVVLDPLGTDDASGPVTTSEVRSAVDAFADAYAHEDGAALREALTRDVARYSPGDEQRGRPAVIREYRRQFDANDIEDYELIGLSVRGGRVGRASGRYVVSMSGADSIRGRVVLGVERDDGRARVGLIATTPRS